MSAHKVGGGCSHRRGALCLHTHVGSADRRVESPSAGPSASPTTDSSSPTLSPSASPSLTSYGEPQRVADHGAKQRDARERTQLALHLALPLRGCRGRHSRTSKRGLVQCSGRYHRGVVGLSTSWSSAWLVVGTFSASRLMIIHHCHQHHRHDHRHCTKPAGAGLYCRLPDTAATRPTTDYRPPPQRSSACRHRRRRHVERA